MNRRRKLLSSYVLVAAGAAATTGVIVAETATASPGVVAHLTPRATDSALSLQADYNRVVKEVRPAVVEIATTTGLGSGIVYDHKGDIVTNAHVVGDSKTFNVTLASGKQVDAILVGTYPAGDLAVIRTNSIKDLRVATFADSSKSSVGDIVLAMGSPLGLSSSVTEGIVSANGRDVPESEGVVLPDLIQTSAPINPGNSGGALVNLTGHVIGIPTLAASNGETGGAAAGIGFAIPSNTVRAIAPQLIAHGKVTRAGRAALGITGGTATDASGNPIGVAVASVVTGGPASRAGIVEGELITAIDGTEVTQLNELAALLSELKPGLTTKVSVISQAGDQRIVSVKLGDLGSY
jgi:S1-C subfamily serine protease